MESDAEVGRLEQLARSAGKAAGLPMSRLRVRLLSGENAVNRSAMVSTENGARHVLREYRWPFGGPDDLDRPGRRSGSPVWSVNPVCRLPANCPASSWVTWWWSSGSTCPAGPSVTSRPIVRPHGGQQER